MLQYYKKYKTVLSVFCIHVFPLGLVTSCTISHSHVACQVYQRFKLLCCISPKIHVLSIIMFTESAHGELLWSVVVRRPSSSVVRRPSCVVRRPSTFDVYTLETTFVT